MPWPHLSAQQREQLRQMQVGQLDLIELRTEYALEFIVETMYGDTIQLEAIIRPEAGVSAVTRLRKAVMALDETVGCTVVAWERLWPPTHAEPADDDLRTPAEDIGVARTREAT